MGKNADGSPFGSSQGMLSQHSTVLIIGVLQRPAGAKNGHGDNSLSEIRPIAQMKLTGGPAFRRGRWSEFLEFLYGLFGL